MDRRIIGILMLVHYAIVCVIKIYQHLGADLLWLSHVSLLVAAAGLITRKPLLITSAFVAIAMSHTLWIIDCAGLIFFDASPLGMTVYLRHAGGWTWIATAHHFYLAPTLGWIIVRDRLSPRGALWVAANILLYLVVISRAMAPAHLNVNYALHLLDGVDWYPLHVINALPAPIDILIGTLATVAATMCPTAAILHLAARRERRSSESTLVLDT